MAGHLLKSDSMFAFLAAHRRELFPEEMFADLFPVRRGRPSVPAEVMASVITLQALHGLSDNETVDAVTFDLRWKAACGLPVTAGAFHSTTLTYWRRRLAASDRPNRIFEAVKAVVRQTGALAGKQRRALDSTVLDDACSATRPTAPEQPELRWPAQVMSQSSNRCHCVPPYLAASPATTSPSTSLPAPRPARPLTPCRSALLALCHSKDTATHALWYLGALPPSGDATSR